MAKVMSEPLKFGRIPDTDGKRRRKMWILIAAFLVAIVLPPLASVIFPAISPTLYGDIIIPVDQTLIYVLLALGLNVVVGYAGLLDLGYAAFFAIGAYTMGFLTSTQTPWYTSFHLDFWIALPISFVAAGFFGVLLGAPTLGLRGDYLAIVTLGFGEIVPTVFKNLSAITGGNTGLGGIKSDATTIRELVSGTALQQGQTKSAFLDDTWTWWYYLAIAVIVLSIFLILRMVNSRVGRAWMAMREDEIAASAMGINIVSTKLIAFGTGASFAGFAGAIYASTLGTANPSQFLFAVSILVLAMVILGGMGNIWGVIFGALALELSNLSLIPSFTNFIAGLDRKNEFLQNVATSSGFLIFGLILVSMMLLRPEGIFPSGRRKMELKQADANEMQPLLAQSDNTIEAMDKLRSINYNPSITERSTSNPKDRK
jgi:branched-chain amino acid transport system permease protein